MPVSGLPEDIVVNTFAVDFGGGTDYGDVFTAFDRFYNTPIGAGTLSLSNNIGWTVERSDGLRMEVVEDPQTPPNVPSAISVTDLDVSSSTGDPMDGPIDPLPQEVSVCSSFFASGYPDVSPTPGRLRGRVYIGPLGFNTIAGVAEGLPSRPGTEIIDLIAATTQRLVGDLDADGHALCVWSRVDGVFRPVVGGWVDNEWDTQRRRGRKRTTRTMWP